VLWYSEEVYPLCYALAGLGALARRSCGTPAMQVSAV
jgi:hypothetical protein